MALINNASGRVAAALAGAGPRIDKPTGEAVVAQLHEQAARAPGIVSDVAQLDTHALAELPVLAVSRQNWAKALATSLDSYFGDSVAEANSGIASLGLGGAMAVMGRSVLGQYVPFSGGQLLLVAPNILAFGERYSLDRRDLALWVSVHEMTHAAQFAAAPWMESYIVSRARALLDNSSTTELSLETGPGGDLMALMTLLEGHAEFVMNDVPLHLMPSKNRLIEAMSERRNSGSPLRRAINKALGTTMKMSQYTKGSRFVEQVIAEIGYTGFNRIWEDPLNAPTSEEITAPLAWVHRMRDE